MSCVISSTAAMIQIKVDSILRRVRGELEGSVMI